MPSLAVTRKGIIIDLPISPAEALLGATIQVPTFDDPVLVKIPKGAQSGQELRLRGKGIKRGDTFGDLLLRLLIQNPHSPSDEESRKIANLSSDSVTRNRSELTSILKQFKQST
jgi:curved DNA-binding protein